MEGFLALSRKEWIEFQDILEKLNERYVRLVETLQELRDGKTRLITEVNARSGQGRASLEQLTNAVNKMISEMETELIV